MINPQTIDQSSFSYEDKSQKSDNRYGDYHGKILPNYADRNNVGSNAANFERASTEMEWPNANINSVPDKIRENINANTSSMVIKHSERIPRNDRERYRGENRGKVHFNLMHSIIHISCFTFHYKVLIHITDYSVSYLYITFRIIIKFLQQIMIQW